MFSDRVVNNRRGWRLFGTVGALLLLAAAAIGLAAAAGGTTVSSTPTEATTDVGETTTVQIVVDNAQSGVGAAEFRVGVDENVAEITDVDVHGSGSTKVTIADNGSFVDVEYAFRDTADTGSVTIAEVVVLGHSDGSTAVSLEAAAGNNGVLVFDEGGAGYDVTDTNSATLSVGDDQSADDSGNGDSAHDSGGGSSAGDSDDDEPSDDPVKNADESEPLSPPVNDDGTQNTDQGGNEDAISDPRNGSPGGPENQVNRESPDSVSDSTPGFGFVLTVVALLLTAKIFRARKI